MTNVLLESAVQVMATLLITLIGVLGSYLTIKLGRKQELAAVNAAQQEVIELAQQTVGELQQTMVENLKAAHADGKLTKEEIASLRKLLVDKTMEKMSVTTYNLLAAAAVDIGALIRGAGENLIAAIKRDAQ